MAKNTDPKGKKDSPEFVIGTVNPKDREPTRFLWFGRDFPRTQTAKSKDNKEVT